MITQREAEEKDLSIQYLRHGFPEAFKLFFFQYYPELFSFSQMLLQQPAPARKVAMEAFFLLWTRRKEFDSAKKIKAFLYLAIRNKCLQRLKAPASNGDEPATGDDIPSSLPPDLLRELFAFAARAS
ncbi:MAG TPA: sigma factor [Puia sp.]|jgi:DNA-directed RNA polymerase specialized sigma24 family protein|nr:sigma factor [Puia sp.]